MAEKLRSESKARSHGAVGSRGGRETAPPRAQPAREPERERVIGAPGQLKRLGTDAFTASASHQEQLFGCDWFES